jgi:hypothetical protein
MGYGLIGLYLGVESLFESMRVTIEPERLRALGGVAASANSLGGVRFGTANTNWQSKNSHALRAMGSSDQGLDPAQEATENIRQENDVHLRRLAKGSWELFRAFLGRFPVRGVRKHGKQI